jgi:hypothetical protein
LVHRRDGEELGAGPARVLLAVIADHPEAVEDALRRTEIVVAGII